MEDLDKWEKERAKLARRAAVEAGLRLIVIIGTAVLGVLLASCAPQRQGAYPTYKEAGR